MGRGRWLRVRPGVRRIDGVMGQPLGGHRQIPGVGQREESAHQDGAGGRGHREPSPGQPGPPARARRGAGGGRSAPRAGTSANARNSENARNSASARASPVSSLLSGADVRAARTWATGCHRAGSSSGVAPRPRASTVQSANTVQRNTVQRSTVQRARVRQATVRQSRSSKLRSSSRLAALVQQRVKGPLQAGTVRPAAPLAFRHAAFETTRRPDALRGAGSRSGSRAGSRVMRPRMLMARNRA